MKSHTMTEKATDLQRGEAGWTYDPANPQDCSYRDDVAHNHDECLERMAAEAVNAR